MEATASRPGVIPLAIKDKETLYASYMPFLSDGGLFVPTNKEYELGEEVFVLLSLLEEAQRFPVTGRVVWSCPKPSAGRPAGIGIHFTGQQSVTVQKKIETYLAGSDKSDRPTYTM